MFCVPHVVCRRSHPHRRHPCRHRRYCSRCLVPCSNKPSVFAFQFRLNGDNCLGRKARALIPVLSCSSDTPLEASAPTALQTSVPIAIERQTKGGLLDEKVSKGKRPSDKNTQQDTPQLQAGSFGHPTKHLNRAPLQVTRTPRKEIVGSLFRTYIVHFLYVPDMLFSIDNASEIPTAGL